MPAYSSRLRPLLRSSSAPIRRDISTRCWVTAPDAAMAAEERALSISSSSPPSSFATRFSSSRRSSRSFSKPRVAFCTPSNTFSMRRASCHSSPMSRRAIGHANSRVCPGEAGSTTGSTPRSLRRACCRVVRSAIRASNISNHFRRALATTAGLARADRLPVPETPRLTSALLLTPLVAMMDICKRHVPLYGASGRKSNAGARPPVERNETSFR